jgi:hypothetical protein
MSMALAKQMAGVAAAVGVGFAVLGSPSAANANVILMYTGNDFTTFNPPGQTTYTTADKVTVSITWLIRSAITSPLLHQ